MNDKIVIRHFMRKDVSDLMNCGFSFGKAVLVPSKKHRIFHAFRLIPRETGLVAYHLEDKRPIGHLLLVTHTKRLYSIKFVFVNPKYRGQGVATRLINYAFCLANKRGGEKVFLTVDNYPDGIAAKLYEKLGFKTIANSFTIYAAGFPELPFENKDELFSADLRSKKTKKMLRNIYESCMGSKWVDFFENDDTNIQNGYSQDLRYFCSKSAFINKQANSFAIVSHTPLLRETNIELYLFSNEFINPMLNGLFRILRNRGVKYAKVNLFNVKLSENNYDFSLLNKMNYVIIVKYMGKSVLKKPQRLSAHAKIERDMTLKHPP